MIPSLYWGMTHRNRQGNEQMRTFEPTNESAVHYQSKINAANKEYSDLMGRNQRASFIKFLKQIIFVTL